MSDEPYPVDPVEPEPEPASEPADSEPDTDTQAEPPSTTHGEGGGPLSGAALADRLDPIPGEGDAQHPPVNAPAQGSDAA